MSRIETIEQLRREIMILQLEQKQKEVSINEQLTQFRKRLHPLMSALRLLDKGGGKWDRVKSWLQPGHTDEKERTGSPDADGSKGGIKQVLTNLLLNKGIPYALPYFLNRILFRSKVKANLISLLEVALTEGAKSAIKNPKTTLQQARNAINNAGSAAKGFYKGIRKSKNEKHGGESNSQA